MALEKLEGAITFTAAQTVDIVEAAGPTATVTVAAAGTYYLTSNAALLSAITVALNDNATLGGTYTATLDDDADSSTGQITLSATGVGATFSLTWNTTALRDALGWAANLSGAASYQSPAHARYLFLPNCGRSNPMAPNPTAVTQDMGVEESDYTVTVAPSGASKRLGYNRRLLEQLEWSWLRANKTWIQHETVANESLQKFYRDVIAAGRPFRYHPDRSSDSVCFEWAAKDGHFKPAPVVPTWVGSASGWTIRIPVIGQAGSGGGLVAVSGSSSIGEAADTLSATGTVALPEIQGTLSVTEAGDTITAAGIVLPPLLFWVKSDVGITETGSGVSTWADQSGNGKDLTQTTDSMRPPKVNSVVDGYPVVRFLSGGTPKLLSWASGPGGGTIQSAILVWKQVAKTGTYQMALYTASNDAYLGYSNDNPTVEDNGATSWGTSSTTGNVYCGMWSYDHTGGTVTRYIVVGDATELNATPSKSDAVTYVSMGYNSTTFALESDIVECRIYGGRLTSTQWSALYADLKARYPSLP